MTFWHARSKWFCLPLDFRPVSAGPWFFLVVNLPVFISLSILPHLSLVSKLFFFWGIYVHTILLIQAMYTSSARSIHRPPCARFLHFLISIRLLLTPLYHRQIFPVFSSLSLLLSAFLSVSLFRDCSGWSPCGTPCRVPNLFIISALCKDARGMLKYMPPHSGYKWAAVSRTGFPLTWPQGWTELPNTNGVLKFRLKAPARCSASNRLMSGYVQVYIFLISSVQIGWYSLSCVFEKEAEHSDWSCKITHARKNFLHSGFVGKESSQDKSLALRRVYILTDTCWDTDTYCQHAHRRNAWM